GISSEGCILDLGLEHNIVQKSGSFFSYGEERLGQGRGNVKSYLRENPAIAKEIEQKVYEAVGIDPTSTPATEATGAPEENGTGDRNGTGPEAKPQEEPAAQAA